ncbi:MAG TPA: hypothetical protein VMK12_11880 [Anaeromyxobacteraceae bacterium]|nr:hypothetical protein [Anaeromyxobacteraceae bacterium]
MATRGQLSDRHLPFWRGEGSVGLPGAAAIVAAILCTSVPAAATVQVDPVARLTVEGGYDSNALYNGRGGDMSRVSPDLGIEARDHTWRLNLLAGGDLLMYEQNSNSPIWNERGSLVYHSQFAPRLMADAKLNATYASDPIGLAKLGIFSQQGAFVATGGARVAWRIDPFWKATGTFDESLVRFNDGTGAASHVPGLEVTRALSERLEVGGIYRFDVFDTLGGPVQTSLANELFSVARYRFSHHGTLEGQVGSALWRSFTGSTSVLPEAALQLMVDEERLRREVRVTLRHGVGLGLLAAPGLFDTAEVALTTRLSRRIEFHVDGGLWRSGDIPWGANGVTGYGMEGEVAWLFASGFRLGLAASRFARADSTVTTFNRNTVGLRFGWELPHR